MQHFFRIFGLCNNYAYVVMLSAAEDILHRQENHDVQQTVEEKCIEKITSRQCQTITTGAVLLADILPCLLIKLSFPFFMQKIPFGIRHLIICSFQVISYLIVAFSTNVMMSLTGVVFASVSSGLGEITYLALTPYFDKNTISTWSSGTGGAGIIGALSYAALTEPQILNLSPKATLLLMLIVPVIFALTYWCLLVVPESIHQASVTKPATWVVPDSRLSRSTVSSTEHERATVESDKTSTSVKEIKQRMLSVKEMLMITFSLFRFTIPLMLVYLAEYLINQGIVQLIVYPCDKGWHLTPTSQYRWYQVLYQAGVFISRSSINIIELPYWALVLLPVLQAIYNYKKFINFHITYQFDDFAKIFNVVIFFLESLYFYIPHIWVLFVLILAEGLFGGSAYVNTFSHIHSFVKPDIREFAMSISSVGDSIGIVTAGFASIPLHNYVCSTSLPAHMTASN
ncbi:unnamed protein product [Thelazia callipaeda]|uniref:Battenin n=1 Tax=Thelazia callipaeda TaxID=103827 RepID=A0A158RBG6_THECL|nr:unnamed protein product [Thelazia callipaeda]